MLRVEFALFLCAVGIVGAAVPTTDALGDLYTYCHNTQPPMGVSWETFVWNQCNAFVAGDNPSFPTAGITSPYSTGVQWNSRSFYGGTGSDNWSRAYVSAVQVEITASDGTHNLDVGTDWIPVDEDTTWDAGGVNWMTAMSIAGFDYSYSEGHFVLSAVGYKYVYALVDVYNWVIDEAESPTPNWEAIGPWTAADYSSSAMTSPGNSVGGVWIGWFTPEPLPPLRRGDFQMRFSFLPERLTGQRQ